MAIGFFQKRIEEIINNVLSADEATELTTAQLEQISSQLALYFSTVLLTLAGLLFMFFILGWLFRKKNDSASGTDKALHRQHILRDLESQILHLSSQPAFWLPHRDNFDTNTVYEFSLALSPEVRWQTSSDIQTSWHMGDRLLEITDKPDLLTASVLDEVLFWFRRIDRAVASDHIKVEDIYELWRQILPFALDNRFTFMSHYFNGGATDETDQVEAVRQVLIGVIRYCQQQKIAHPLSVINGRLDPLFFESLPKGMKTGLQAAQQNMSNRREPMVTSKEPVLTMPEKPQRQEPVVTAPGKVVEKPKAAQRKEPIVSFDNVDVETKKPE